MDDRLYPLNRWWQFLRKVPFKQIEPARQQWLIVNGYKHKAVNRLVRAACCPLVEKSVPELILQIFIESAALEVFNSGGSMLGRNVRIIWIFELNEQVSVMQLYDKVHCLHAMAQSMTDVIESSRLHHVIEGNLEIVFGERGHDIRPMLRSIWRS